MDPNNTKSLHVLVVSNHWNKGSHANHASIWADRQITALRALGVKVSTFDIGTSHSPLRLFRSWRELRRMVREMNPDVVHARYGTLVAFLSVLGGKPSVVTFAGSDLLVSAEVSRTRAHISHLFSHLACLRASKIICVSEGLRSVLWWRRNEALVFPDGVDLEKFIPIPIEQARARLGWPLDEQVVLMDALRAPILKGLSFGQDAIALVKRNFPKARLELVSGVTPSEMPVYMSASNVLLCASSTEGSPNIVKESLACNLPVVSVAVGDVEERLRGVTPSRIVPRRAEAMADAICELLQNPCRSNGREQMKELTLDAIAQRVWVSAELSPAVPIAVAARLWACGSTR